jgi:hypothetical protein
VGKVKKNPTMDRELPDEFHEKLAVSLAEHIVSQISGGVRVTKVTEFAQRLCNIALLARDFEDRMKLDIEAVKPLREHRLRCTRAKAAIRHSLNSLGKAEAIGREMIDKDSLLPGWLDFEPSKKALERIKKRIVDLESTAAALVHPDLRKRGEEQSLASKTPHKLTHLEFKPTEGSSNLQYWVVEVLEDQIREFAGGNVPPHDLNQFISEFLTALSSLGLNVQATVDNVRVIRTRNRNRKQMAESPSVSSSQQ